MAKRGKDRKKRDPNTYKGPAPKPPTFNDVVTAESKLTKGIKKKYAAQIIGYLMKAVVNNSKAPEKERARIAALLLPFVKIKLGMEVFKRDAAQRKENSRNKNKAREKLAGLGKRLGRRLSKKELAGEHEQDSAASGGWD